MLTQKNLADVHRDGKNKAFAWVEMERIGVGVPKSGVAKGLLPHQYHHCANLLFLGVPKDTAREQMGGLLSLRI